VYSLEYTDIPKVLFMPRVGRCCTAIPGYSCINVTPGYCFTTMCSHIGDPWITWLCNKGFWPLVKHFTKLPQNCIKCLHYYTLPVIYNIEWIWKVCTNFGGEFYTAKQYIKLMWTWVRNHFLFKLQPSKVFHLVIISTDIPKFDTDGITSFHNNYLWS
jgi:hypothetical protein